MHRHGKENDFSLDGSYEKNRNFASANNQCGDYCIRCSPLSYRVIVDGMNYKKDNGRTR